MPELPDVTVYVESIASRIAGQPLQGVRVASPFVVRTFDPPLSAASGRPRNEGAEQGDDQQRPQAGFHDAIPLQQGCADSYRSARQQTAMQYLAFSVDHCSGQKSSFLCESGIIGDSAINR